MKTQVDLQFGEFEGGMAKVRREHNGHDRAAGPEVVSSQEYAVEQHYDASGRSFGGASCGGPAEGLEQHVCMGLNACNAFDVDGGAVMAGTGNCATVRHVCHGEGQCRGQGGCGYAGGDDQQWRPGEQACRFNGSCASPLNVSRVFSAGPMKGRSVWLQARRLMEDRMYRAGLAYGPSPGDGIPDDLLPEYDVDDGEDLVGPVGRRGAASGDGARRKTAGKARKAAPRKAR
ncbi:MULTISPECIES: hypothetical protein [Actinomadura]|uniref:Uncharacterized protein n=1 Tax=Actinomadura litoris TaxID=2678616 RepID=A0A7K1KT78_9ACTN|nr:MULTISPECIES: hypothetical protein [Actinomadura]MBT2207950.1 hypothetical protein [Actinomadura sp. NEAU-AAG7]MUN35207.1 hypothetical protein [Actinomadura litoris]